MSRKVSFIVSPGFELLNLGGPLCAFSLARDLYGADYDVNVVSAQGGPITNNTGLFIDTLPAQAADHGDTILVLGGDRPPRRGYHPATAEMLIDLAPSTRRIASICTGAFHLADADLLHGRRATTHWNFAPLLQSLFPKISVDMDRIYIKDGPIWTSAGLTAGIDLTLALIEEDFGAATSKGVAQALVLHHRRAGGQSQFSALVELAPASGRIHDAINYAREHLHETLSVERLAATANLSTRQFARLFLQETGETPAKAVERLRAEAARYRIEEGSEPLEVIAASVGFDNVERMRRSCVRLFGKLPQSLRRLARTSRSDLNG